MNIENYCERELHEMREICRHIQIYDTEKKDDSIVILRDICRIALVEINRELDERMIRR